MFRSVKFVISILIQIETKPATSPTRISPPLKASIFLVGSAADFEGVGEGCAVEDVPDATVDDAEDDVEAADEVTDWPSAESRTGSAMKVADTPEELLQVDEEGVPTPATKFTAMHCTKRGR